MNKELIMTYLLSLGFFSVIILPYLVFGFYFVPWFISIPDIIDLVFYGLVIGLTLYCLYEIYLQDKATYIRYIFIYLFVLHFTGHGFHWAANALNETIKNAHSSVPSMVSEYAYFLDEIASHYIMYPTFLLMLLLLLVGNLSQTSANSQQKIKVKLIIPSVIFGASYFVSSAEAQLPYLTIIFAILFLVVIFAYSKKKETIDLNKYTFALFILESSIVILITALVYWLLFPGFPEPSEILA